MYLDRHRALLKDLPDAHVHKLADMWQKVYNDLSADDKIKCVFIFDDRGEVVGVTMPHSHGQAYGYSCIPKKLQEEIEGSSV